MEEQLPRKFGKYTLLRKLAVGGMAEIFLALHRSISGFEKLLVIKRILPNLTQDGEFLQMFLDEARIAATLNHPNIAQIYDVGSVGDSYFIAMEYVHGEDLRSIVRAMKKKAIKSFPLEHGLQIVAGVCAGLDFAHTRTDLQGEPLEIVHRDISPQNVLVTFAGDVKVVDFGIAAAKIAGMKQNTDRGQLKGKIPYMSPEQCQGEDLDHRSDIFSMGILLWELTTGRRLFRGETEFNTLRKIVEEPYPRPTQFVSNYSPELEQIVMRALAKDRESRYASARDLQADLEEFTRHNRLRASSLNLATFLEEIFGDKLATQREALAQGKRLADIIAQEEDRAPEIPSDELVELDDKDLPISDAHSGAPSGAHSGTPSGALVAAQGPPSTGAWVEEKKSSGAKRLAMAIVALVLVLGVGGAVLFFSSNSNSGTRSPAVSGQLEVSSTPDGASIALDNETTGMVTPHVFKNLRVDRTYQVKLSLDGYRPELREVKLTSAHSEERVSLELTPSAKGIVTIKTAPRGAQIYFDGRPLEDHSPTTIAEIVPLEEHTVLVKLAGYVDQTKSVTVAPGKAVELLLELVEAPLGADESFLVIESEPDNARIVIDDDEVEERTPFKMRLAAGRRVTVEIGKAGFDSFRKSVKLTGGDTVKIAARLDRSRERNPGGKSGPNGQRSGDDDSSGGTTKAKGSGWLYFNAVPYCNVAIDGRAVGVTPIVKRELSAGRHTILCNSPPIGVSKHVVVNVPANGTVRRQIKLAP